MARTVFHGAQVFDGTGSEPYPADVAIEADRIVAVGPGLDGDQNVDVSGLTLLPGLFDTHVHVTLSGVDLWRIAQQPFSYQFYLAQQNLRSTLEAGITSVRDAGGADLGIAQAVDDGLIAGPRMQVSLTMLSQTGGHGNDWLPSGNEMDLWVAHPGRPSAIVDGPEAGKLADLVVVEGDPFAFDDLAERIQAVWKSGSQVTGAQPTGS